MIVRIVISIALALLTLSLHASVNAPPRRVVSINVCTDALLAELLPRERIAAISHLGLDPHFSPRARALVGLRVIRGDADEVLALDPDLVVGGKHAARATLSLLERLGVPVLTLELADSVATARAQMLLMANALGVPAAGARAVASLDYALSRAREHVRQRYLDDQAARRPRVLLLRPNGFTSGPQTLEGDVLRLAGLDNVAGTLGIRTWGNVDLEQLIATPLDAMITDRLAHAPSQASALLNHRAMRQAGTRIRSTTLATNLFTCPGPWLGEAVLALLPLHDVEAAAQ